MIRDKLERLFPEFFRLGLVFCKFCLGFDALRIRIGGVLQTPQIEIGNVRKMDRVFDATAVVCGFGHLAIDLPG